MFALIEDNARNQFYPKNVAVRAVIIKDGLLYLMHVKRSNTYVLVGGGVLEGETLEKALYREVREETGYEVVHATYATMIDEYHKNSQRRHHIYRVEIGETMQPLAMTDEEQALSMRCVRMPLYEGINALAYCQGTHPYSEAIQMREFIALMHTL